ncbi:MAG: hypothetical protein A3K19_01610 [Lentisphaerae bacterium RIFOXYB12_FULL_65_16]|nr:MAG: hypothetical protein A3K18_02855 [Lentisphaerae bacterium RIFOXYA12_64_32]OGV92847.1 MAG: hypothetical protein A3K19_01610 [Lentisphaerae bacterium RIFOXYB12_FULL_65_16]
MRSGIVFDIREFTVHDGPGIRTTVFLKGCPLSCTWCHNPEGLSPEPERLRGLTGERLVGESYTAEALAEILNRQAAILRANEGGVTFSGGEPLLQAPFVAAVIDRLDRLHVVLDTSGYATKIDFLMVAERTNLVYYGLKLMEPELHRRFVGGNLEWVLSNLRVLSELGKPFVVRVPLVPGVTDTAANLAAIAEAVAGLSGLERVDLLPYNRAAGGKYRACGREFRPGFDETRPVNADVSVFERLAVPVRVV